MPRQPNGYPKVTGPDEAGYYHCYPTVGRKPNGDLDRRHIKRKTMEAVAAEVDRIRAQVQTGTPIPVKVETVEQWLLHWVNIIVKQKREHKTWAGYRSFVTVHALPAIGFYRLAGTRNPLEPEHVEALYVAMGKKGLAPSYIRQGHTILKKAFKDAVRRGKASRNVCDLIDAPAARRAKIKAHTLEEATAIITAALKNEWAARWYLGLMYGLRQGETLGIHWSDLDLTADQAMLHVHRQIQRQTYEHGCTDPVACARKVCARRPKCATRSDGTCSRHARPCPPPHPENCTDHARQCPDKVGGLVEKDVKSEKGDRTEELDANAVELLIARRERQQRDFDARGLEWSPEGLVFTTPDGMAIDPGDDHEAWEELLGRAEVADSRLHAARHTAGTLMLATGTDIRVIQEILGHSRITVTEGYVDVAHGIKRQAVDRVANLIFSGNLAALLQPSGAERRP